MTKKSSLELIQEAHDSVRKRMRDDPVYATEFLKSLGLLAQAGGDGLKLRHRFFNDGLRRSCDT